MSAATKRRIEHRQRQLHAILKEYTELRVRLNGMPDPENYERHARMHDRLDELLVAYMRLKRCERARN